MILKNKSLNIYFGFYFRKNESFCIIYEAVKVVDTFKKRAIYNQQFKGEINIVKTLDLQ